MHCLNIYIIGIMLISFAFIVAIVNSLITTIRLLTSRANTANSKFIVWFKFQ